MKRLVISKYICLFGLELRNLCPRLNLKDNKHGKIYFDYAANTPLDPQVRQVLMQFYEEHYGNSAGIHAFARDMREHLDREREFFARYLGARSSEIVFTASATESNNLVFKGLAARFPEKNHLLISAVEHASVLQTALYLEKMGFEVEIVPVDQTGQLDPDEVKKGSRAIRCWFLSFA